MITKDEREKWRSQADSMAGYWPAEAETVIDRLLDALEAAERERDEAWEMYLGNINDRASVMLTAEGARVARAARRGWQPGQTVATELWDLMQIFGSETYMSGPLLFVDNKITIKRQR